MFSSVCDVSFPEPVFNNRRIGVLENPGMTADMLYAERSGISVISGWVCDADEIVIEINGAEWQAGYGTHGRIRGACAVMLITAFLSFSTGICSGTAFTP